MDPLIISIWFVLCIELTLRWNSISDIYKVNTTGQLIPFVTGLGATAAAILNAIRTPPIQATPANHAASRLEGSSNSTNRHSEVEAVPLERVSTDAASRPEDSNTLSTRGGEVEIMPVNGTSTNAIAGSGGNDNARSNNDDVEAVELDKVVNSKLNIPS